MLAKMSFRSSPKVPGWESLLDACDILIQDAKKARIPVLIDAEMASLQPAVVRMGRILSARHNQKLGSNFVRANRAERRADGLQRTYTSSIPDEFEIIDDSLTKSSSKYAFGQHEDEQDDDLRMDDGSIISDS